MIEFRTGPAVPPHATWKRLEATAASVLKGDFDRGSMVRRQGFETKLREFLPGNDHP